VKSRKREKGKERGFCFRPKKEKKEKKSSSSRPAKLGHRGKGKRRKGEGDARISRGFPLPDGKDCWKKKKKETRRRKKREIVARAAKRKKGETRSKKFHSPLVEEGKKELQILPPQEKKGKKGEKEGITILPPGFDPCGEKGKPFVLRTARFFSGKKKSGDVPPSRFFLHLKEGRGENGGRFDSEICFPGEKKEKKKKGVGVLRAQFGQGGRKAACGAL